MAALLSAHQGHRVHRAVVVNSEPEVLIQQQLIRAARTRVVMYRHQPVL
jgi:hypothetical protein